MISRRCNKYYPFYLVLPEREYPSLFNRYASFQLDKEVAIAIVEVKELGMCGKLFRTSFTMFFT
jgi:hypothetical protein